MKEKRKWKFKVSLSSRITTSYVIQLLVISFLILSVTLYFSLTSIFTFINSYGSERANRISSTILNTLELPFLVNRQNEDIIQHRNIEDLNPNEFRKYLFNQYRTAKTLSLIGLGLENGYYGNIKTYSKDTLSWSSRDNLTGNLINWELDSNGHLSKVVYKTDDYDHRKKTWYNSSYLRKEPGWSPIYISTNPKTLLLSATNPIYNDKKEFLGVALSSLSLSVIQKMITEIPSRRDGNIYILEMNGDIIAETTREQPFIMENGIPQRLNIKESQDQILKFIYETDYLNKKPPEAMHFIKTNRSFFFISYQYLTDEKGLKWIVILSDRAMIYLKPMLTGLLLNLLIVLILMGLSIGFGKRTARNIITPILTLRDLAHKINKGDLDQRVHSTRDDELGQLNNSFNLMAARISDLVENLENKVEDRTKQLEKSNNELILSQKRVELHIKNTPLALIEWDKDFNIIGWNPSAERIFGYRGDEVINKHNATLLVSEYTEEKELHKLKKELIEKQRGIHKTNENITKDGRKIICDWQNTPLIDEKGELIGITSMARDITEEVKLRKELLEKTRTDGLTGIANRRIFDEYLIQEWKRAERSEKPLSLIMVDIDLFKNFNDYYGHLEGDSCLKSVASILSGEMKRTGDFAARYGGEEFACILPDTNIDGALSVAQDIVDALEKNKIPHADSSVSPFVTLSLGVACTFPGQKLKDPDELIRLADKKLYMAKRMGRDQIQS